MYQKIKQKFSHTLIRNSFFGSAGFVFISLIGLVITPLLVANFGMEQYGVYMLVTGIFGYYGIFDIGLGQGLIKFVAEFKSLKEYEKLITAVNSVLIVQAVMGIIFSVLIFLYSPQIIAWLNVSTDYTTDSIIALKIASIGFFFSMIAATYSAAIKGLEKFGIITGIDSATNLLLNILLIYILSLGYGIKTAVQINLLIAIIQLLSYYIVFKRLIVAYRLKCEVDTSIIKKFLSFSGYLYLSKITRIIRTQGVRFLISYFINPAAVTLYIVPNKLIVAASGLLSSAVGALFPYTSSLSAGHKIKLITETFYKTMVVFLLVGTPMFVFLIFNAKYILTLWIGLEFAEQTEWVLVFLALTALIGSLTMVPINMLLGIGRTDIILYFAVFNFTLYVILLPYLTAYYGIMGLVVGMFLATLLNLGLVISKSFDALGITFKDSLDLMLRKCIPLLLFCMLMAIVKYLFLTKTLVLFASSVANLIIYYFFVSKFILEINFAKVKEVK